jgi:hypothetical protein
MQQNRKERKGAFIIVDNLTEKEKEDGEKLITGKYSTYA